MTMSMDTHKNAERDAQPTGPSGSYFDSNAHWHTRVAAPRPAATSFSTNAWTKVLALCLGVLLALTMLDTTTLSALSAEIGDSATPMAATANPMDDSGEAEEEEWNGPTGWAERLQQQSLEPTALTPDRLTGTVPTISTTADAPADQPFDFEAAFARLVLLGGALVLVVVGLVAAMITRRKNDEPEQGDTVGLIV